MKINISIFKLLLLSSIFVGGNLVSFSANAIECVGPEACPPQVNRIKRFAHFGSPSAQLMLATLYEDGNLVVQSDTKAFKWYRKASKQLKGIGVAFYKIGVSYLYGRGTEKDINKGLKYLNKAATKNYANAQLLMGFINYKGEYVKKDFVKARYWFNQAAENHDPRAAYALAKMSENGLGGNKNLLEAKKWYLFAAAKGYKDAAERVAGLKPSEIERKQAAKLVSQKDEGRKNVISTTYANNLDEIQMMNLVLENAREAKIFDRQSTGSHIPGQGCVSEYTKCDIITEEYYLDRLRRGVR